MGDSVLTSPCFDENQGGMIPSSQRFPTAGCLEIMQIHQEKYKPVPVSHLTASPHLSCFSIRSLHFCPRPDLNRLSKHRVQKT